MTQGVTPVADKQKYRSHTPQEGFLYSFYGVLQTCRIHSENHRLVVEGIAKFYSFLSRCMRNEQSLSVTVSNDRIFFQEEKLPYNPNSKNLIDNMVQYFNERNLEGLKFHESFMDGSEKDFLEFMVLLDSAWQRQDPAAWLLKGLEMKEIHWVDILEKTEKPIEAEHLTLPLDDKAGHRERAKKDYTHIMASFKEVARKVTGKGRVGIRKTVRVVQDMVSHLMEDDEVYSAISTLRVFDDYTFTHSVNVSILSMCIGKRINLSRRSLERLGICGLFHDLGKIEVPYEILNKPGKLDDIEFKKLEEHSLNSAKLIVKLRASRDRKAKILLPPFEHHLKYDLSGYPFANWKKPLTLFGKIIAIADVYDAITSPRVYRKSAMSPDRALGLIFEGAGKDFDPILIKVFINMLGIYPVGTLLKLDNGELALVESSLRERGKLLPHATIMRPDTDGTFQKGEAIDLTARNTQTGEYARRIIETYHPSTYGIQPVQQIFSDS